MGGRVMDEYIERGTLMRRIKEIHCAECDSYHGVRCRACWVDDTLDYIDSEPAADVAPVVRCKDCKHYLIANEFEGGKRYMCEVNHFSYINSDGDMRYCSYGERKDGTDAKG